MRRYLGAILVLSWLVAACGGSNAGGGGGGGGGGAGGDLPTAPTVLFGASYDPTTLAVTGKATSIKQGSPIVAVARTFSPHPASDVTIEVGSGATNFPDRAASATDNPAGATLFAVDLSGDHLTPGTWIVQLTAGGRIVASGFLTVTP